MLRALHLHSSTAASCFSHKLLFQHQSCFQSRPVRNGALNAESKADCTSKIAQAMTLRDVTTGQDTVGPPHFEHLLCEVMTLALRRRFGRVQRATHECIYHAYVFDRSTYEDVKGSCVSQLWFLAGLCSITTPRLVGSTSKVEELDPSGVLLPTREPCRILTRLHVRSKKA